MISHSRSMLSVCPFGPCGNSDSAGTAIFQRNILDPSLTLAILETAVVAHGAEELKYKDGHSHNGQAHDKHHHPHRWAVGLFERKQTKFFFIIDIILFLLVEWMFHTLYTQ